MQDISPSEVIRWFREKASEFQKIADCLERTFPGGAGVPSPQRAVSATGNDSSGIVFAGNSVNIQDMANLLKGKAGRVADIAERLGCNKGVVEDAVAAHPELFEVGSRGWVRLKEGQQAS